MSWVLPILRFPSPRSAGRGRVLSRKTKCVNAFMKTEPDTRPGVTTRTVAVVWRLAFGFATLRGAAGTAELAAPGRRGAPFRHQRQLVSYLSLSVRHRVLVGAPGDTVCCITPLSTPLSRRRDSSRRSAFI